MVWLGTTHHICFAAGLALASAFAVLVSQPVVVDHEFVDLELELPHHTLQLSLLRFQNVSFPFGFLPNFVEFLNDGCDFLSVLVVVEFLLAGDVLLGLFEFQLGPLLAFLQFGDLVFQVEDVQMQILIFVAQFFDVGRVLALLLEVLDLFVLGLGLSLQFVVALLHGLQAFSEAVFHFCQQPFIKGNNAVNCNRTLR